MNLNDPPSTAPPGAWTKPEGELSPIDWLYNAFDGMYLGRWKQAFPDAQSLENWKTAWSAGLRSNRVSFGEIKAALVRCPRGWPPDLLEFLALCRPPPDYESLFVEAARNAGRAPRDRVWSSPLCYWAAVDFGLIELRNATYSAAGARWRQAVEANHANEPLCAIPPVPQELPEPKADPDKARAALEACQAILSAPRGRHDWAQRIIARIKAGEPMPDISRRMACKALSLELATLEPVAARHSPDAKPPARPPSLPREPGEDAADDWRETDDAEACF